MNAVSLPLGSFSTEFIFLDSVIQGASRAAEDVCMDSIETMDGVLELMGEMMGLLPPQETM